MHPEGFVRCLEVMQEVFPRCWHVVYSCFTVVFEV